jgi:UDP-N-acetylmuramoyl-L-alanyl-D-glutamate--2,6-diaminopimelate ligase
MTFISSKKLQVLLSETDLGRAGEIQVNQLTMDSRAVKNGGLFIAIKGQKVDGREFIANAVEQGAAAILVEADKKWQGTEWINQLPVIAVDLSLIHI